MHGFVINSGRGADPAEFPNVFVWDKEDREWSRSLLWRDTWVPVSTGEPGEYQWKEGESRWRIARLDKRVLSPESKVGLIYGNGRKTDTVPLFIEIKSSEDEPKDE